MLSEVRAVAFGCFLIMMARPGFAQATPDSCQTLFSPAPAPAYGSLRSDFVHDTSYTVEVANQSPIKNQCGLEICHLATWNSGLEHSYQARTGTRISLSLQYQAAKYWIERSFEELANESSTNPAIIEKLRIELANSPIPSRESILKAGVVPDSAWKPKTDFMSPPLSTRLAEYIENVIGRARVERALTQDISEKLLINLRGMAEIAHIFESFIGPLPTDFVFGRRTWTPTEFAKENFPELTEPTVTMRIESAPDSGKTRVKEESNQTEVYTNIETVERTIRKVIDSGQEVFLAYQHQFAYVDMKTGIISIAAFHNPQSGLPLNRASREFFGKIAGGHAVRVVGYDLDVKTDQVKKWKIKTSWSEKVGDHGYFHMYADYFRVFASYIVFGRNLGIPLPANEVANAPAGQK